MGSPEPIVPYCYYVAKKFVFKIFFSVAFDSSLDSARGEELKSGEFLEI